MKPFRIIHFLFGVLASVPLVMIAAALVLSPFQNAESSRIEGLQTELQQSLEAYRQARGHYPDSLLQALTMTNCPRELRAQSDMRKMTYKHTEAGYDVSYNGRWYHSTLSVSNNGASIVSKTTAK
jgi:hypothetical protein